MDFKNFGIFVQEIIPSRAWDAVDSRSVCRIDRADPVGAASHFGQVPGWFRNFGQVAGRNRPGAGRNGMKISHPTGRDRPRLGPRTREAPEGSHSVPSDRPCGPCGATYHFGQLPGRNSRIGQLSARDLAEMGPHPKTIFRRGGPITAHYFFPGNRTLYTSQMRHSTT